MDYFSDQYGIAFITFANLLNRLEKNEYSTIKQHRWFLDPVCA
jgi:hypothetical protein